MRLDREVNAVVLAVRNEVRVDLVVGDSIGLDDIGAVEHLASLLHIRDGERVGVKPLADLKRAVVTEFEVDTSGARLTVRTSHEGPRFFRQVRKALTIHLLTLIDADCEDLTATEFVSGQFAFVLGDILVTVDTNGRLSVCGCVASVSLKRGEKSSHFDKVLGVEFGTLCVRNWQAVRYLAPSCDGGGTTPFRVNRWGC